jgi:hypothetical protein
MPPGVRGGLGEVWRERLPNPPSRSSEVPYKTKALMYLQSFIVERKKLRRITLGRVYPGEVERGDPGSPSQIGRMTALLTETITRSRPKSMTFYFPRKILL